MTVHLIVSSYFCLSFSFCLLAVYLIFTFYLPLFPGGALKSFGFSISQLTTPMVKYIPSSPILQTDLEVPSDNREKEVLYASVVFAMTMSWLTLQSVAWFDGSVKPWATLFGLLVVILGECECE